MHFLQEFSVQLVRRIGSKMLKRVHSHIKSRKPTFLEVGLTAAHRSKSLSQIDCLDNSGPAMTRRDDHGADNVKHRGLEPPEGVNGRPDRLLVPSHSEDGDRRLRQIPSQETFTVSLDVLGSSDCEVIPALRGVALRDALHDLLDHRGIDINTVQIFLDGSNSPLCLTSETFHLGGNHIRVKAKDWTCPRTTSGSDVGPHRFPLVQCDSFSTKEEKKRNSSQKSKRSLQSMEDAGYQQGSDTVQLRTGHSRRSGPVNPFKTDKEKMELMTELLNQYSQHGMDQFPGLLTFPCQDETVDFRLEDHWTVIVDKYEDLSKRMKNQQDTIWELLETEVLYIKKLQVFINLFLACLCNLQNKILLNEIEVERIFSNIGDVYQANREFWASNLLPMLSAARATRQPLNPLLMKDGFLKFSEIFKPYTKYCLTHNGCLDYVRDRHKTDELFKTYVAWCETQKDCERMRLMDLLVKPVQRITKYPLLLKAIHKKTEDEEVKRALLEMNDCVEKFVCGVDSALRQQHEEQRLSSIINRIDSYEVVECPNDEMDKAVKEYSTLRLTSPMPGCSNQQSRHLLLEGSGLKLRDQSSGKTDVHCFLFTDMLLICKAITKKGERVKVKVVRQPYLVDRLVMRELRDGSGLLFVYLNEFDVATAAFSLHTPDSRQWAEQIRKAQANYREAKEKATEKQELWWMRTGDEEEDTDFPSTALLQARSARSSSRSSLVHSHSGSMDMSDPASAASSIAVPVTTFPAASNALPHKAVSFELDDLRSSEESFMHNLTRAASVDNRIDSPVCVTVTSPRPDRRAMLRTGASSSSNTLSVGGAFHGGSEPSEPREQIIHPAVPPTLQIPVIPPNPKTLQASNVLKSLTPAPQRAGTLSGKPPLVKTKNVSGTFTFSPLTSEESNASPAPDPDCLAARGSFDSVHGGNSSDSGDEGPEKGRKRRGSRGDRRYHTADGIEHAKAAEKESAAIVKRLSWNADQKLAARLWDPPLPPRSECHSSDSVASSSSTSLVCQDGRDFVCAESPERSPLSDDDKNILFIDGDAGESEDFSEPPSIPPPPPPIPPRDQTIRIDVGNVTEGIASVQITVNGGAPGKASKLDLRRMKDFLLTNSSVESSEV